MIPPSEAARRLLWAVGLGAALGVCYELLRPLRRRGNTLGDLIFVSAALYAWLYLSFGICAGDVRFGCTVAMGLGAVLWEWLPGRLLRPVYAKIVAFWRGVIAWFLGPWQKIFKKMKKFFIFLLAFCKKWFTIGEKGIQAHFTNGGKHHGEKTHAHSAGIQTLQPHHKGCAAGGGRDVHHRAAGAARLDP